MCQWRGGWGSGRVECVSVGGRVRGVSRKMGVLG